MNVNAKQVTSFDQTRLDITSVLGFFTQIKDIIVANTAMATALNSVWTVFLSALAAFDDAFAQSRKWLQTDELKDIDKDRDDAVRGFMNALKSMLASPNAQKAAAARRIQFARDKYDINPGDEYMKETTAVTQLIQDLEANYQADLALTGLDEWLVDLKTKNEAFLAKMNERTDEQSGLQKGIVREKRLLAEAAYRDLVKLLNAMSICEVPAGLDFNAPIDRLNAEIEHYRQILARKGVSTGSSSNGGGGSSSDADDTNQPTSDPSQGDGSQNQGGDQPTPNPSQGDGSQNQGGGGDDNGGDNGGVFDQN